MTFAPRSHRSALRVVIVAVVFVLAGAPSGPLAAKAPAQAAAAGQTPAKSKGAARSAVKPPASSAPVASVTRPKLVVILVVDQMRADYVEKFGSHWTAGLRRLIAEGAWYREAAYPYMTTVTCAGHSTVVTGSLPATHGVFSNNWWDREAGRTVNCVADPEQALVSYGQPATTAGGTSTKNLRVPAIGDEMRAQLPTPPRIVTISLKDYTATTMAGRRADAATWFNLGARSWMTSTAFTKQPVPFVAQFIEAHPIEADYGRTWAKLLPESAYLYDDDGAGEDTETWGRTFPHVLKGKGSAPDSLFYAEWDASPFSDAYLGAMAEYAVDALKMGRGPGTDYLAVSFSALDVVGHDFGPRSHEVQDVLAHLDRTLGALLAHLDARVGRGNYTLALTADHGVAPIPEQMAPLGFDAGRILSTDMIARVEKALEPFLGAGKHVARMVYNDLYFVPGDWQRIASNPEAVRAVMDTIRATPGVAQVFRGDRLGDVNASAENRVERAAARSYYPGRSGDLVVLSRPYWLYTTSATTSSGTGHGSPYDYDQHVPLILFGKGIEPGQHLEPASPADIAPTLAFLCGITLSSADGRVLNEALTQAARAGARATTDQGVR